MKKETALKRIRNAVERACSSETEKVKEHMVLLTYSTFVCFENDRWDEHTSSENLKYAIFINLEDELEELLEEARKETA